MSAKPAEFTGTTVMLNEIRHPNRGILNVVGYQNTAKNKSRGKNALIIAFPTAERLTRANVIDTDSCKRILKDMKDAALPEPVAKGLLGGTRGGLRSAPAVQRFTHGIYDTFLAQSALDIDEALRELAPHEKPDFEDRFFRGVHEAYRFPYNLAVMIFDNAQAREAAPVLWQYKPFQEDYFFLPALDAHDGGPPIRGIGVKVDHVVLFGSFRLRGGNKVHYSDKIPSSVAPYLPQTVIGKKFNSILPNGDFVGRNSDIAERGMDGVQRG